jgi:hypothetical protein
MSWTPLKENYTDAVWSGLRKYNLIENSDDTISLQDVTVYSQKENSFYGASDANRTNAAINIIMAMLENGTDLYTNFQQYFASQQTLFEDNANQKLSGFDTYLDELESTTDTKVDNLLNGYTTRISQFESTQEALFNQWFNYIKDQLSEDAAGHLMNICTEIEEKIAPLLFNNAGAHNGIYRGKYLGTEVTAEQWAAIADGTFKDLFIGDYWIINDVTWRIAAFDYWLHCGDEECTNHHVLIVPDTNLYDAKMNNSTSTTGAYVGSAMYTANLATAKTMINNAFGSAHILNHRVYLSNAMEAKSDPTYESAGSWYDSTVELMNEKMVYGTDAYHNVEANGTTPINMTIDKSQLPLFALEPSRICNRKMWWLRDAVNSSSFALVHSNGT